MLDAEGARAVAESTGGARVTARSTPDAQVYASGMKRLEHAKVLRDLERAVMAQHHAARAHAKMRGVGGDVRDEHFRSGAGEAAARVMLGEPVAVIAPAVAGLGELEGLRHRVRGRASRPPGRVTDHAETRHG